MANKRWMEENKGSDHLVNNDNDLDLSSLGVKWNYCSDQSLVGRSEKNKILHAPGKKCEIDDHKSTVEVLKTIIVVLEKSADAEANERRDMLIVTGEGIPQGTEGEIALIWCVDLLRIS